MKGVWCQSGNDRWYWCSQQQRSPFLGTSLSNFSVWKSQRSPSPLAWTSSAEALWATVRFNDLLDDILGSPGRFLAIWSASLVHWNWRQHWLFYGHQETITQEHTQSWKSGIFDGMTSCPTLRHGLLLQIPGWSMWPGDPVECIVSI